MSHCISNQTYSINIEDAPISQSRVTCHEGSYTIYLDKRVEKIAPNVHEFLHLYAMKFIDVTQEGMSDKHKQEMQNNVVKQIAVSVAVFALGYYSMNYLSATLISSPLWFLAHKVTNCSNERMKIKEVDIRVIKDATPEYLKGGLLFYKACQRANQNKNSFFFTHSGDNRFPSLESTPTLEERIHQIEQKLKDLKVEWQPREEDQKTIKQIENLFHSIS
ncbi:MAG: hypothetical protein ACRCU0_04700 [Candidatus Rhabdochlamydia sp.]